MAYKPIGWVDGETPLNAENLNHMDEGIKSSVRSINGKTPDENGNVEITIPDSGQNGDGLTNTEKNLILRLFEAAVYTSDQSANIAALREIFESGENDGGTPSVTTYTIINDLTNVITDNNVVSVALNDAYIAKLTPVDGYKISSVIVIMGDVDITGTAYSDGKINIALVTGNVVITATAQEDVASYAAGIINDSGELAATDKSYVSTRFLPLSEVTFINVFDFSAVQYIRYNYYDTNHEFVSRLYAGNGTHGNTDYMHNKIPYVEGAAYVKIGFTFNTDVTDEMLSAHFDNLGILEVNTLTAALDTGINWQSGALASEAGKASTDYIELTAPDTTVLSIVAVGSVVLRFYDSNHTFVSSVSTGVITDTYKAVDASAVKYARIEARNYTDVSDVFVAVGNKAYRLEGA